MLAPTWPDIPLELYITTLPDASAARERDLPTVDGLAMLIGQAAPSFEALFRRPPPPLDLRALLMTHLGEAA